MTLPAYHFDVEEREGRYVAFSTELDGVEAEGATYDEAIENLARKVAQLATEKAKRQEPLPEPLYFHLRPL
ncbi:MAG: hypothetical protein D6739_05680 [Nitrospirae bacterium]|nr:MAG: hypothetical protein D6739_05680 [Nitrospirota bacterium]